MKKKTIYLLIIFMIVFALVVPGSLSSAANDLFDGGFEQYPDSGWWYHSEPIGGVFMNSTLNDQFIFDSLVMPAPLCGHGIYNVGKTTYPLDYRNGSVPAYQFHWDGGTLYWQAAILGPWFSSFFPVTAYSYADIYITDSQGVKTQLLTDHQVAYGEDWARHYGSTNLAAGSYTLFLGRGASMEKSDAYFYKYQLFYDDVYLGSSEPSHTTCSDSFISTPTWEPTQYGPTETPTSMDTPTGVFTPTQNLGWHWHPFTNSYDWQSCPVGDLLGGAVTDVTTYSNTLANADPDRSYDGWLNENGVETHTVYQMGAPLSFLTTYYGHSDRTTVWLEEPNYGYKTQFRHWDTYNNYGWAGALACYGNNPPTATPTLSPTPGPSPTQTTKLGNCGFESGDSYWFVTPPSYIDLAGGPAGPQNAVAVPNSQGLPNIWQNFYWPVTQPIYIQGWSKGQTQVRVWNIYSNFEYKVVYSGNDADWFNWQSVFSLPMGYYRLELNTFLPEGSEGRFDGITLAADNFLNDAYCSIYTPTPGPTSFVTPTPGPSLTPSLTMTPRTSRTPWGTSTLWPSGTPSLTPSPGNAQTQTALASITPGGGPGSTSTPGPGDGPPEQPPGGEGAPCQRPQSWQDQLNLGWWLDYEFCDLKRFVSWGPSANATAQAIPTMFANKEPFKTVGDITTGFHGMQTQVAGQPWNNTGFDGVQSTAINPEPNKIFSNLIPGQSDPWAEGGVIPFNFGVSTPAPFLTYCNTRLSSMLASRLAEGLCFALNVTKKIGYLGWIQFLTNFGLVFLTIRMVLSMINMYGNFFSNLPEIPQGGGKNA